MGLPVTIRSLGLSLKENPSLEEGKRRVLMCIIGREDDIDKIMRKLLDPDVKRDVSCLAIVGMGGLGKTALAQLVYNHPRTEENFPLRLWACVADQGIQWSFTRNKIRTCLHVGYGMECIPVDKLLKHWMCLRALDLSRSSIKTLPNGLDKLLHLRYLNLSYNPMLETLPNSVTKLHNLQTLILRECCLLRELPESLPKLVKLSVLDVDSVFSDINKMPRGMGKLGCLQQLSLFVVGDNNSTTKQCIVEQMEELKVLTELKGSLRIRILKNSEYIVENAGERGYIRNKQHLSCVGISFPGEAEEHNRMRDDEEDLVYIENTTRRANISDGAGTSELDAFFPSLQTLRLSHMRKLKGWWRDKEISNSNGKHGHQLLPSFPHLIALTIESCPNLTRFPPCPTVEELQLRGKINENLVIMVTSESGNSKLRRVKSYNVRCHKSILPMEGFQCLEQMVICWDDKVESLSEVGEVFRSCSSSLKSLQIRGCCKLKSLCGALEHLTVLESLEISGTPSLNLDDREVGENDDGKPWQCLHQSLRFLKLESLPELVSLPKGMQYLTALQSLSIIDCKRLESLPESMRKLTSLKTLEIWACSAELNERCRELTGDDWPKIQHIPHIAIHHHRCRLRKFRHSLTLNLSDTELHGQSAGKLDHMAWHFKDCP
ncbi:hypothetical protein Cgig2_010497 [Carnegiea gigantea]|uniref:Uncharacterized protein n=1 Tax=Carnegiea gigantea TaxID=171969 RepID=A0A9Q1KRQ1_9CARY|nr:hypothetical protein Cgig2_010497 [Carnegiea gigantea]